MGFRSMPTGAKVGAAGMGGIAMTSLMYRLLPPQMFFYVMIGTAVLGLLMGLFGWLVHRFRKRKAKPMEQGLRANSAATPQGVAEPGRRARLDDLRKNFEEGVDKFKAAGKDLYSLPWYALVGEPGSGKTEAVRHSQVPRPPGLQDELQGVGGTINMNWWFTNHAVILDTAGRLMFEEVEPGATGEWREFLKLLRANRPNCPINGMLLCIPADSLIKDSAEDLERKGAKIAQQLDQIQRALSVRFPVFVMITKCDLVNGFREFFEGITRPDLQMQMLGWSNPAPLDDSFNPELVDQHLQTVVERLNRRRLGLLLDPVNTEDPSARRTDQVDALYAFPDALMAIAPRLRRYLEMIFVAGEWSAKPLFLRGIYFTSSMREGDALDADLAEALGVPVENLPEGKVWDREKSYFLRDLFMNKVFKEKGLVTNATNAKKRQRRRKLVVLGTAFLAVVVLGLFTWWGVSGFRASIGDEAYYWAAAAQEDQWDDAHYWLPIVMPEFEGVGSSGYKYTGRTPIEMPTGTIDSGQFHHDTMELVRQEIKIPWVFSFAATLSSDINANRRAAQRVLFEAGVLRPLVDSVRRKMLDTGDWSPKATVALSELLDIESEAAYQAGQRVDPNALFAYVLKSESDFAGYRKNDAKRFDQIIAWTYDTGEDEEGRPLGGQPWPPPLLGPTGKLGTQTVDKGVADFIRYWEAGGGSEADLGAITTLKTALTRLSDAEGRLIALDNPFVEKPTRPDTLADLTGISGKWNESYAAVLAEGKKVDQAVVEAEIGSRMLTDVYDSAIREQLKQAEGPHKLLIGAARPGKKPAVPSGPKKHLEAVAGRLETSLASLQSEIQQTKERDELVTLDPRHMPVVPITNEAMRAWVRKDSLRLYALRLKMYELANVELGKTDKVPEMSNLAQAVKDVRGDIGGADRRVENLENLQIEAFRVKDASGVSRFVNDRLAKRKRIYTLLEGVLQNAPKTAEEVSQEVVKTVKSRSLQEIPRPVIRGTDFKAGLTFPATYHRQAAKDTFAGWKTIESYLVPQAGPDGPAVSMEVIDQAKLNQLRKARQDAYNAYLNQYKDYWIRQVLADLAYDAQAKGWKAVHGDMIALNVERVCENLEVLGKVIDESLVAVQEYVPAEAKAEYDSAVRRVRDSVGRLRKPVYVAAKKAWLAKWADLSDVAERARRTILPLKPGEFKLQYLDFPDDADTDISQKYWKELSYAGLKLLADEININVGKAYTDMLQFSRFPLSKPKGTEQELTAAEIGPAPASSSGKLTARDALDRILGISRKYSPDSIGGGQRTQSLPVVDTYLDRLCGQGLEETKRSWCMKVQAILAGLPAAPDETMDCSVRVLAKKDQDILAGTASAVGQWAYIEVTQGGKRKGVTQVTQGATKEIGKIAFPGKEVAFQFYRFPANFNAGVVDRTVKVPGQWGAVRLLHRGGVDRPKRAKDGTTWQVQLVVTDQQGRNRSLWVELVFPEPLPKIDDWP